MPAGPAPRDDRPGVKQRPLLAEEVGVAPCAAMHWLGQALSEAGEYLCAVDSPISIVAVVDPDEAATSFFGVRVVPSYDEVGEPFEAVVVTHLTRAKASFDQAIDAFGTDRVLAPDLLGLRSSRVHGAKP